MDDKEVVEKENDAHTKPKHSTKEQSMCIANHVRGSLENFEAKTTGEHLQVAGRIIITMPNLKAGRDYLANLEDCVEAAGQQLKRQLFCLLAENEDQALILSLRSKRAFHLRGKRPLIVKSVFGTCTPRRIVVQCKEGGEKSTPSAAVWGTGHQVYVTQGLKKRVCQLIVSQSATETMKAIDRLAGERDLISHSTVLNILHERGANLAQLLEQRVTDVYSQVGGDPFTADEQGSDSEEGLEIWVYDSEDLAPSTPAPPDRVVEVEVDEVKVRAQACTNRKEVWVYTGTVTFESEVTYFSAPSSKELFRQIEARLALYGVHKGQVRLEVISDGARWIRKWYEQLRIPWKRMVLCWYHLLERCKQLVSLAGLSKGEREKLLEDLKGLLWEAKIFEGIDRLMQGMRLARQAKPLEELAIYFVERYPYILYYAGRHELGRRIASTRVEKFNHWAVASRCKRDGIEWTPAGVLAIASFVGAARNGDWDKWWEEGDIDGWGESFGEAA